MTKTFVAYVEGDADPTPSNLSERKLCMVEHPGGHFVCTWEKGHDHPQHVAGDWHEVCAVWDV